MAFGTLIIISYYYDDGRKGSLQLIYPSFTPPFGFKFGGLPFELMTKSIGNDIGEKIGEFLETDKRSWQFDQAKFMRIRVNN